jgi:hypothetical protein
MSDASFQESEPTESDCAGMRLVQLGPEIRQLGDNAVLFAAETLEMQGVVGPDGAADTLAIWENVLRDIGVAAAQLGMSDTLLKATGYEVQQESLPDKPE